METVVLKVSGMETEKDPKKVRRAAKQFEGVSKVCLLYTSDAADEL